MFLRLFSIQLKFTSGQKFRLILQRSLRNRDIWKTALKKSKEEKAENFQLSWRILEKKNYQPIKSK